MLYSINFIKKYWFKHIKATEIPVKFHNIISPPRPRRDTYKYIQQYYYRFQEADDASLIQHSHCEVYLFQIFCFFL